MITHSSNFGMRMKRGGLARCMGPRKRLVRAEYAVICGDGWPANSARTRDPIVAYRWLRAARAADWPGASQRWLGVRQLGQQRWRRHGPALRVPELTCERVAGDPAQLFGEELAGGGPCGPCGPCGSESGSGSGEVSVRRARLRVASLLGCRGLDGAATASLLPGYEGFFPSVDVGVARMLQARLGGQHLPWLRRVDLPALLRDLIAGAAIWTLRERGDQRWPAGVHIFTARSHRACRRDGREVRREGRAL